MISETIKNVIPILVFITQIALGLFILILIKSVVQKKESKIILWFKNKAIVLSFIVVLTAMLGSLFYSNILGYAPCTLCWWQRIFIYSQVFILGTALILKDKKVLRYSLVLSCFGIAFSVYQYILQILDKLHYDPTVPCSLDGPSCAAQYTWAFGYITIPMMAMTALALVICLALIAKYYRTSSTSKKT